MEKLPGATHGDSRCLMQHVTSRRSSALTNQLRSLGLVSRLTFFLLEQFLFSQGYYFEDYELSSAS